MPLENISDDEQDAYSAEDESDIDLEADSEENEEQSSEEEGIGGGNSEEEERESKDMPPKKATPKKVKVQKSALGGNDLVESISNSLTAVHIDDVPMFSMDYVLPFMISTYNESNDQMATIEVLVPMLPQDSYLVDIVSAGRKVLVNIQVPPIFVDEVRVHQSNVDVDGFNEDTYQAQAFKDRCENINATHRMKNIIFGNLMHINLPFVCKERIVGWEILAFANDLGEVNQNLNAVQYHAVLAITVRKLRSNLKKAGGFRVVMG